MAFETIVAYHSNGRGAFGNQRTYSVNSSNAQQEKILYGIFGSELPSGTIQSPSLNLNGDTIEISQNTPSEQPKEDNKPAIAQLTSKPGKRIESFLKDEDLKKLFKNEELQKEILENQNLFTEEGGIDKLYAIISKYVTEENLGKDVNLNQLQKNLSNLMKEMVNHANTADENTNFTSEVELISKKFAQLGFEFNNNPYQAIIKNKASRGNLVNPSSKEWIADDKFVEKLGETEEIELSQEVKKDGKEDLKVERTMLGIGTATGVAVGMAGGLAIAASSPVWLAGLAGAGIAIGTAAVGTAVAAAALPLLGRAGASVIGGVGSGINLISRGVAGLVAGEKGVQAVDNHSLFGPVVNKPLWENGLGALGRDYRDMWNGFKDMFNGTD